MNLFEKWRKMAEFTSLIIQDIFDFRLGEDIFLKFGLEGVPGLPFF